MMIVVNLTVQLKRKFPEYLYILYKLETLLKT